MLPADRLVAFTFGLFSVNSIIQKRARDHALEKEQAAQAQRLAEAWIGVDFGNTVDVLGYAPIPSTAPSRASSILRVQGPFAKDGID